MALVRNAAKVRPAGDRLLVAGAVLLVALGLVIAASVSWTWYDNVRTARHEQARLAAAFDRPATAPGFAMSMTGPGPAAPGEPVARLKLPGLSLVVVEGTAPAQLATGPGRISTTSPFGAEGGNAAVAAHRYPGLFWDLDDLATGTLVTVETRTDRYVYRVVAGSVVSPDDTSVLSPRPGVTLLTLITCTPVFSTARRLIRHAELVEWQPIG